jgi:hypothetical protein
MDDPLLRGGGGLVMHTHNQQPSALLNIAGISLILDRSCVSSSYSSVAFALHLAFSIPKQKRAMNSRSLPAAQTFYIRLGKRLSRYDLF